VKRAPGRDLVEKVVAGRRPDPRAEPLELDLDSIDPNAEESGDAARKLSSTQTRAAGTDWMDEATTLKMRLR
jgi:hypothetical protein